MITGMSNPASNDDNYAGHLSQSKPLNKIANSNKVPSASEKAPISGFESDSSMVVGVVGPSYAVNAQEEDEKAKD